MTEANASRKVVLIAEASADHRALLRRIFANEYKVEETEGGVRALEKLRALSRVDLLILGLATPGREGFETLERIRGEAGYSGLPVIAAMEGQDEAAQNRALDLGAEDVFTKPYNPRLLLARARNVILKADGVALQSRLARQEHRPCRVIGRITARREGNPVIYATYTRVDEEIRSLRRMLTEAVENIPAGIGIFEQRGEEIYPIYVSDNVCAAFGYTRAAYDGRIARGEPVFSPVLAQALHVYHAHSEREITHERVLAVTRTDGTPFDLRVRIRKRLIGEKILIYCTLSDVTRHMESERQKRIQDERYRLLVELRRPIISDYDVERDTMAIIVHREDGTRAESVLANYSGRLGSAGIMLPDSREEYVRLFRQALDAPMHGSFAYHADYGMGARWYRAFYSSLADQTGAVSRALFMSEDITQEHQEHQKLLERAEFDPVTRLLNRASAEEFLKSRLEPGQRSGMDALFMIDIDDFKLVNDSLGHQAGDRALQKFADTLRRSFRAGDLICRFGGDEFVVFMPGCGSPKVALSKGRGLIETLAERRAEGEDTLKCSIGITMIDQDGLDMKALLAQADRALYLSKRHGKNTCTMYEKTMKESVGGKK